MKSQYIVTGTYLRTYGYSFSSPRKIAIYSVTIGISISDTAEEFKRQYRHTITTAIEPYRFI